MKVVEIPEIYAKTLDTACSKLENYILKFLNNTDDGELIYNGLRKEKELSIDQKKMITQPNLPIVLAEWGKEGNAHTEDRYGDLDFGGHTVEDLEKIHTFFKIDSLRTKSAERLFEVLKIMATDLFSMGDLEKNIISMINHFKANTGENYSNAILNKNVREHASNQRFVNQIKNGLYNILKEYNGDVSRIKKNKDIKLIGRPHFNSYADTFFGGLTIAINDTSNYLIELVAYQIKYKNGIGYYSGSFKVTLIDHFGLDISDVEKVYVNLAGFRAWFALQHLSKFGYKPYKTVVENTYTFKGDTTKGYTKIEQEKMAIEKEKAQNRRLKYKLERATNPWIGPKF